MRGLRAFFFGSAILLACASLAILGSYFALQPTTLRIAIPSNDLFDLRIFGAAAEILRSQRTSINVSRGLFGDDELLQSRACKFEAGVPR